MSSHEVLKRRQAARSRAFNQAGAFLRRLVGRPEPVIRGRPVQPDRDIHIAPPAGRWLTETFANFVGMRQYQLYVPSAYRGQPLPLIVMLHGCKQSPDDFAAGTRMNFVAEEHDCFVAYPSQPKSANGLRCWNWFNPRHQYRGRGEPSLIAGITSQIVERYNIDRTRVYVAGLSAGGAATAIMAATYPDIYAAAGIHSGLARGVARTASAAYAAMRSGEAEIAPEVTLSTISLSNKHHVPTIIFHGDRDDTVHVRNGDQILEQSWPGVATMLRHKQSRGRIRGGHSYTKKSFLNEPKKPVLEMWTIHNSGHAWSGGCSAGSYTDPQGPDASREMMRFFLSHRLTGARVASQTLDSGRRSQAFGKDVTPAKT